MIEAKDLEALKEVLGEGKPNLSQIQVFENSFLDDNQMIVSSAIFKALKSQTKETGSDLTIKEE